LRETRPVASVADVVKTYRVASGEVRALRGVSAEFPAGAVSAVVGPSGSGKSTLLRLLAGIDRPTSGRVRVLEVDVHRAGARARRRLRHDRVGYLFQRPSDNLFPHLTLAEHLRLARAGRRAGEAEAREVVATLGLRHRLGHRPAELSGGEQQRAAVALALLSGASVILADEPTAQLDRTSGAELIGAMREVVGTGVAFVVATHDPQVRAGADEVVELDHGSRVETHRRDAAAVPAPAAPEAFGEPVLTGDHLTKSYRRGDEVVHAVQDVTLALSALEFVALSGRSGSGKSTLLHMLAGWEPADAGSIHYRDGTAPPPWRELAVVPQQLGLLEELTVRENVAYPARLAGVLEELGDAVDELLDRLGLAHLAGRYPPEISVGEQQRTSLARAVVLTPSTLLVDEPTGHQDAGWAAAVLEELRRTVVSGSACIAATHDPLARRFADRELALADGRLVGPEGVATPT
jgi:ABC-type lipoprotein export system ATPase subunit